ncbi:MAG: hypothetical protein AB7E37_03360 [Candidatus Altimarinota bacterium]
MNELLQAKVKESRARIAELRALRGWEKNPQDIISNTQQQIQNTIKQAPFSGDIPTLSTMYIAPPEHIPETDASGDAIDLASVHGVMPEVCITIAELMDTLPNEEFEQKDLLDVLQRGMVVNLGIAGFKYFKILKVCSTEAGNDLFIVNFKYKDSKPAKVTLILKFNYPIKPGTGLTILSSRTQKQLGNIHIVDSLEVNTKNVFEKMLEKFGF